jgi:hypothetical protein
VALSVQLEVRGCGWSSRTEQAAVASWGRNSSPDGYTFCVCSRRRHLGRALRPKGRLRSGGELAPVGIVSSIVQIVVVKKDLPVKTMSELVSHAKAHPGKLNFGSSGAGGLTHFAVELFQARTERSTSHSRAGCWPLRRWSPARSTSLSPT